MDQWISSPKLETCQVLHSMVLSSSVASFCFAARFCLLKLCVNLALYGHAVCLHVCACVYMCKYMHVFVYVHMCCVFTCVSTCMCVCVFAYAHVHVYMCVCVCLYV